MDPITGPQPRLGALRRLLSRERLRRDTLALQALIALGLGKDIPSSEGGAPCIAS